MVYLLFTRDKLNSRSRDLVPRTGRELYKFFVLGGMLLNFVKGQWDTKFKYTEVDIIKLIFIVAYLLTNPLVYVVSHLVRLLLMF